MSKASRLFRKVDTVIVRVKNLEMARAWYEEKLGFRVGFTDDKEKLVVFDGGGETSFTIWELKPGEKSPPADTMGSFPIFYADDMNAINKELKERSVKVGSVEGDPKRVQWFTFWDLDGNRIDACHY